MPTGNGNSVKENCAISRKLHKLLGVGFAKLGGNKIGTANPNAKIKRLGVSNPIEMRINGIQKEFQVSPSVVSELSDSFNIGNGFLIKLSKKTPCQISFQDGNTKLQIGNQETELIRVLKTEEFKYHIYMEKYSGNVFSKD